MTQNLSIQGIRPAVRMRYSPNAVTHFNQFKEFKLCSAASHMIPCDWSGNYILSPSTQMTASFLSMDPPWRLKSFSTTLLLISLNSKNREKTNDRSGCHYYMPTFGQRVSVEN